MTSVRSAVPQYTRRTTRHRASTRRALTVVCCLLAVAACSSGGGEVALDGSPRFPDDQGVATDVIRAISVELDDERTYEVRDDLLAFSTNTPTRPEPMVRREGQYVLVGLRGGKLAWMAGISQVLELDGKRLAFYDGTLVDADDEHLIFEDGTVLTPAVDLPLPATLPMSVGVEIDVDLHQVVVMFDESGREVGS